MDVPLDLDFKRFESFGMFATTVMVCFLMHGRELTWLHGASLIGVFLCIALGFAKAVDGDVAEREWESASANHTIASRLDAQP